MEKVLITRDELCERWGLNKQTIINYEANGIITKVKNIPIPRYNLNKILKLEGTEINPLSPLEKIRLERKIVDLEIELRICKDKIQKAKISSEYELA